MRTRIEKRGFQPSIVCTLLLGTVVFGGAACGAPAPGSEALTEADPAPVPLNESLSETGIFVAEWTDISTTVHVRLYRGIWNPPDGAPKANPTATCEVGPDEVVVGGGAETWQDLWQGPFLTASYPEPPSRWVVKSKDHGAAYTHWTRAFCLGLRLDGVSVESLRDQMYYHDETSWGSASWATVSAHVPDDYVVVGGGGHTNYGTGAGMLLTENFGNAPASVPGNWAVAGKDHGYLSPGSVTSYVIGIPHCPADYSGCLTSTSVLTPGNFGGAYQDAVATAGSSWAMTAVGGRAFWNGWGRMLTDITPNTGDFGKGGVVVRTKDHFTPDEGNSQANVVAIKRE
jgi:hypothetical protein